jgi:hypothetical protein
MLTANALREILQADADGQRYGAADAGLRHARSHSTEEHAHG